MSETDLRSKGEMAASTIPVGNHFNGADITLPDFFSNDYLADLSPRTAHILDTHFLDPIREFTERPRKNFRATLVECGFCLAGGKIESHAIAGRLNLIKDALECLHAGSLIVDDIQDRSSERRDADAFHKIFGDSLGICTGNWMYFWPMRLISRVNFRAEQEVFALNNFSRTLEYAHYGQFLDIKMKSSELSAESLAEISYKIAELKTGSVTALALTLGALLADANPDDIKSIKSFGLKFGACLQRLDDWGNLSNKTPTTKRFEDFIQDKPTTVWHDVFHLGSPTDRTNLTHAISALPNTQPLATWKQSSNLAGKALAKIKAELDQIFAELANRMGPADRPGLNKLAKISEDLLNAYI